MPATVSDSVVKLGFQIQFFKPGLRFKTRVGVYSRFVFSRQDFKQVLGSQTRVVSRLVELSKYDFKRPSGCQVRVSASVFKPGLGALNVRFLSRVRVLLLVSGLTLWFEDGFTGDDSSQG